MNLASEIQHGTREELIAYLKSWRFVCPDTESDIELRLAACRNFQMEGPGMGPVQAVENAARVKA
jgi:hypothetical protein